LKEIQTGKFPKEFLSDYKAGKKRFEKLRHADDKSQLETVGTKLRGMMKWM
jgi:ketol-acid reductoisomerase